MNKTYFIIATTFLTIIGTLTNAQQKILNQPVINKSKKMTVTKEETLGQLIFESFKKKDTSLWFDLFPTNAEYKEILQLMLKEKMDGLSQQKIEEMMVQREKEAGPAYKAEFETFLRQAQREGVDWIHAVYKKFDFQPYLPANFSRKYLNGDIWCMFKKTEFVIEGVEAVETPSGFKLQSIKRIRKIEDSY